MSGAEDMANAFGRATEDDKLESFERSTLKLVLRRMGMNKKRVDDLDKRLAEGFTFDWLDNQGWCGSIRLRTTRCFDFDLQALFTAPKKSALIKHMQEIWADQRLDSEDAVIFRANGIGRLVCVAAPGSMNGDVPPEVACLVAPFLFPDGDDTSAGQAIFMTFDDYCDATFTGKEIDG